MSDISDEEKIKIAGQYLLASPPGEFNDVFNGQLSLSLSLANAGFLWKVKHLNLSPLICLADIRVLIGNDALLQRGVSKQFEQYNTEQFTPVDMPGQSYKVTFLCLHSSPSSTHFEFTLHLI